MLAIRLKRQGRKGYPVYRVIVQEAQRSPSSGRVVDFVGSYNPHNKEYKLDKEKIELYLKNGARPTPRVIKLIQQDKITLPAWVELPKLADKKAIRFPDKLRKNQPAEPADNVETAVEAVEPETEQVEDAPVAETEVAEKPTE
jgi:small subunit ribosomal protein S16